MSLQGLAQLGIAGPFSSIMAFTAFGGRHATTEQLRSWRNLQAAQAAAPWWHKWWQSNVGALLNARGGLPVSCVSCDEAPAYAIAIDFDGREHIYADYCRVCVGLLARITENGAPVLFDHILTPRGRILFFGDSDLMAWLSGATDILDETVVIN